MSVRSLRTYAAPAIAALAALAIAAAAPAGAESGGRSHLPVPRIAAATDTFTIIGPTQLGPVGINYPRDVGINSAGTRLLSLGSEQLSHVDLTTNPPTVLGTATAIVGSAIAIRPRSTTAYVLAGSDLLVVSFANAEPKTVRNMAATLPAAGTDAVVSPDGKWLYVGFSTSFDAGGVRVYSLANPLKPAKVRTFTTEPSISALALDRTGKRLAVGHWLVGSVVFVDVSDPRHPRKLGNRVQMPRSNSVNDLVFSPDGKRLFVIGDDEDSVTIFDVPRRIALRSIDYSSVTVGDGGVGIDTTGDGKWIYATFGGQSPDYTVLAIRRSDMTAQLGIYNAPGPGKVAVSRGGTTVDSAYFATSPSTIYSLASGLYGLDRVPG